ncbi:hypothetical protein P175DRAFT_0517166 [Aspergillus ochraceoroseus IBT 24754]|uniref:Uncharacterized protein n=1 Tax=Aspergillus ochraceoroseus IBT 24754 TaxID=1392256 RepID=A0A2T5LV77_9EURO|nr:uncharacterized protein P175DRAFT_0517166 [Aspergillus ochraceoroseus IBT 24754]PTU20182.1 hypothetical protein P175DRAFT_0517166 [Aspergillus ochraceoroseus IBT 24754]
MSKPLDQKVTMIRPDGFVDEDLVIEHYEYYPISPRLKFPMFRDRDTPAARNVYPLIQPALLMSRIIIKRWQSFGVFVRRRHLGLQADETIGRIKKAIPDIDFDPDMHPNSSPFADMNLYPKAISDLITLDYNIIRLLEDSTSTHSQKLAAHVLESCSIRAGQLRSDDEPFETPPDLDFRQLFTEPYWTIAQQPLRPPVDKYARYAILENELIDEWRGLPMKSKVRERDVHVETGSLSKKHRSIIPVNICGGKKCSSDTSITCGNLPFAKANDSIS